MNLPAQARRLLGTSRTPRSIVALVPGLVCRQGGGVA